jgi:hypothetical protein
MAFSRASLASEYFPVSINPSPWLARTSAVSWSSLVLTAITKAFWKYSSAVVLSPLAW